MKKHYYGLVVICFITAFQMPYSSSASEVAEEVLAAVQEGIQIFVKGLPKQKLPRFGFLNQKDVDDATVGQGFQVFAVSPDNLLSTNETSDNLSSFSVPSNTWQFLITVKGKAVVLLTVDLLDKKWTPVSIGGSELAGQLSKLIETWPASSGYRYRLIRVYQAKSEFIELSTSEKIIGIVPLGSARIALGLMKKNFDPADIQDSADMARKIKAVVRKNLD
jgi:hypothetical protein